MEQTQNADDLSWLDESGNADATKTTEEVISKEELSAALGGREFKSKEDVLKSISNLNSFAGDQRRIELEKKAKEAEEVKNSKMNVEEEILTLKKENNIKDFLLANPQAKENLEIVEALVMKDGKEMTAQNLSEAWAKLSPKIASGESETVIQSKNRVAPMKSQRIGELSQAIKTANGASREDLEMALVEEWDKQ